MRGERKIVILLSIVLLLCWLPRTTLAQSAPKTDSTMQSGYKLPATTIGGEQMPNVLLKQVIIIPPAEYYGSQEDVDKYWRLVKHVKKVYPYVQLVKRLFEETNRALDTIPDKKQRKKFLAQKEKELRDQYEEELKRLTVTQGKILTKLVNRELHTTAYELVKEFRGSFSAFFWQQMAKLFDQDLKAKYDPNGEDKMIERIILLIENGQL